ncbi:hypothetical protein glysoja_025403 [Glycine soja]|uniref:Uncharacterized protein n=1 Tax=Glycine soja TaxID=3848 RepID=A0A0B2R937_GLYSO|nr:hypothetical protein glysoja_025403 [Glycine soja]
MLPLDDMNKWFEKKPRGFGEGKVYDTSVEDKLLEEMRQSRIAQAENLTKLKSNPVKHASNESVQKKKGPTELALYLVRLRWNWIICSGKKHDFLRFVELYTGQAITFGKIQKQIKCELLNVQSSSSSLKLSKNLNAAPQLVARFEEVSNEDSNLDGSALSSWDEANSSDDLDDLDYQMNGEEQEDDEDNQESVSTLGVDHDDSVEMRIDPEICSLPSEQVDRNHAAEQKSSAKVKQENARKKKPTSKDRDKKVLGVPGSSRRSMLPGDVCEKVDRVCSMASLPMEVAKWLNANYDSSWKPTKLRVEVVQLVTGYCSINHPLHFLVQDFRNLSQLSEGFIIKHIPRDQD